jgi:hypothetical protein
MSTHLTSAMRGKFQGIVDKVNKNLHEGVLIDEHRGRRQVLCLSCTEKP